MGSKSQPSDGDSPIDTELLAYLGRRTVVVVVVAVILYLTRPLWHGLVYAALYSPSGALFLGGGAVAALVLWYLPPSRSASEEDDGGSVDIPDEFSLGDGDPPIDSVLEGADSAARKVRMLGSILALLFALSIAVGTIGGTLEQRSLAQQTMANAETVEEFPRANSDNPRVVPQEVADITTRGEVSYRQHRLGASDIARREDGSLAWSYPIEPDGFRNRIVENQRGVLISELTSIDERRTTAYDETAFTYGEGMFLHRSADWNLKTSDYLVRYDDDAVEFTHDGTPYMYYPKTGHDWKLTPFPHTVPTWEGGALVSPDGEIEHLTPEEAQANEILDGQRLYPLTLTRDEMESLNYRDGIINQLPVVGAHENEVEVANLPDGADNSQPFVIDLAGEQMSYVTAMEPYGADSRGLDEVWFINAETGAHTFFATGGDTLTGPERAMGIARSEDSQTNWGQNFVVTEPVPVIVDKNLWWHVKVSPTDFTDVTRNVFVDADDGTAVEVTDDEAVRAFIQGNVTTEDLERVDSGDSNETGDGTTNETEQRTGDGETVYFILVTDDDGNVVRRIPVEPGQDTTIVEPGDERARNDSAAGE